jgi:PAS domain S-box-containing protein
MTKKPTYEELEAKVNKFEKENIELTKRDVQFEQEKAQSLRDMKRYRALIEDANEIIAITDAKGVISIVNKKVEEVSGYSRDELIGENVLTIAHPEDKDRYVHFWKDTLEGRRPSYELRGLTKSGDVRHLMVSGSTIKRKGEPVEIQCHVKDITDLKQAEEALRESERKFRETVKKARLGVFKTEFGERLRFIEVNDVMCEDTGYSEPELLSMNPLELLATQEDRDNFLKKMKNILAGKPAKRKIDYKIRKKDGTCLWASFDQEVLSKNGRPYGASVIAYNITDRKEAEEALRESEEKFRVLVEQSPLAVSLIGKNGIYEYINPKFVDIFGYELDDIPTGREWFRKAYPDREYRNQAIAAWISDQEEFKMGESLPRLFEVTCKDGSEKIIHFRPVMLASGEQVVMYEDITEKKRLEDQLHLAQKMEAVGVLAGGVAHDLNNILCGIVSYPDLLLMQLPEDSPLRKPISTIQNSGNKAAAIVQDLLTLARRGVNTIELVNLNDIISEYMKSPEHEKLKSFHPNVEVKLDLADDILNLSGSKIHLSKTVMNLVSNAAEAMTEGGTIQISTENRYIDRLIKGYDNVEEGDYIVLTVSDSGMGISSENMGRIFDPFFTKKQMGKSGTGLGMTVVWGTVKDHKGYIDIQSKEGKGTTFTLYFPVSRQQAEKSQPSSSVEDYMGRGESILVVDDVEEQRDIASSILSELGYSVATVSSGEEAIDYAKTNSIDLLVLDMIMDPGIDGLDTYKQILETHPGQRAIISSGFSETDRVKEAQRLGAGQYINKPYTLQKIGLAVKEELEK